ncbi:MAG: 2,3-bisphosphoglycerate-independent phosphoglycerate mutase [Armatimonadetes bacterium]|nr:2,3-bisphosphoglycerate-independent phosphoglycerate mutase [Armatimonadota bacterium]
MRPVCLIIRDGWGYNENPRGNAVLAADTPNVDRYKATYPWTLLECSGEAVGLPAGFQGSSEVGHLNMGAGRIVVQELKRLDEALTGGTLFELERWRRFMSEWRRRGGRLHLLGLLQDEGVHAHQDHLFKIMRRARSEHPDGMMILHPFLDGRDTPPRSCLEYVEMLRPVMAEVGNVTIGTAMGRYYAMDRSRNWELTDTAYACIVDAMGRRESDIEEAVTGAYERDRTPDDKDMFDEYIMPCVFGDYDGVRDGDCVFHTNYRQDRAAQLTMAFVEDDYVGTRSRRPDACYLGFTRYYDELSEYLMPPMGEAGGMDGLLGEVISKAGLRQLRIAETQKFRHVTSFMNGKATTPYPGEDQVEVPSRFDPATFASHPEMEAFNVADELVRRLDNNPYAFIAVNFANGDMVGHTGEFEAAKTAIEIVDMCLGRVVELVLELDGHVIVTSDHGNSEQMIYYDTGRVRTSHTVFPVECIYIARDAAGRRLIPRGKLADIAPTVLSLMGLPIPPDMTADNLFVQDDCPSPSNPSVPLVPSDRRGDSECPTTPKPHPPSQTPSFRRSALPLGPSRRAGRH